MPALGAGIHVFIGRTDVDANGTRVAEFRVI
jgi:hypothetical protein